MRISLIHALFPEGPLASWLWGPLHYGLEIKVWRDYWLWVGYTPKQWQERGW